MVASASPGSAPTGSRLEVRGWILLAGISLILASSVLFLLLAHSHRQATVRDAETTAQNLSRMLAEHAARVMDVANLAAEQAMQVARDRSWEELEATPWAYEELRRIAGIHPFISAVWLTDEKGWPRVSTRSYPAPPQSIADRPHFIAQVMQDSGPFVTPLIRSRVRNESNIVMSRRLDGPGGAFRGVALTVIDPADFERVYGAVKSRFPVVIEMFRKDLALLIRHPGSVVEGSVKQRDAAAGPEITQSGIGWVSIPGEPRTLEAHDAVGSFRLYVGVGIAETEIDKVWIAEIVPQAAFAGMSLLVILVFMAIALVRARREAEARAETQALNLSLESRVHERTATVEQLVQELNHRVKNSLQLVASLLRIQAAGSSPEVRAHLDEARARVMTIARAHERLHKTGRVRSVDFDGLLGDVADDLSKGLGKDRRIEVLLDAVELTLAMEKAVPLALTVAEIVAGLFTHSYAADAAGTIRIALARSDAAHGRITIDDDGTASPEEFDLDKGSGDVMGMRLITGLVAQVGGRLHTAGNAAGGMHFVLDFPLGTAAPEESLHPGG